MQRRSTAKSKFGTQNKGSGTKFQGKGRRGATALPEVSAPAPAPPPQPYDPQFLAGNEEDSSDDGTGTWMDLSDMLDRPEGSDEADRADEAQAQAQPHEDSSDQQDHRMDQDSDEGGLKSLEGSEGGEDEGEGHGALLAALHRLQPSNPKKRKLQDLYQHQHQPESSWELEGQVSVQDLLGAMETNGTRRKIAKLAEGRSGLALDVAPSKPAQTRLDRQVQYQDSQLKLSQWLPTVQAMRQAPVLRFPLPDPTARPAAEYQSTTHLAATFTPVNDLEHQISAVLTESGVSEGRIREAEDLAARELSAEEIKARHAQLAKLRAIQFAQDQKFRRQAKIKSKKYRRLLRKARERNELTLAELQQLDPDAALEEAVKADKARAEERMTRRHKNMTQWARHALRSKDSRLKEAAEAHLARGQALMKKIHSVGDGSDSGDSDSEAEEAPESAEATEGPADLGADPTDPGDDYGRTSRRSVDLVGESEGGGGVGSMRFMQRAHARRAAESAELLGALDADLALWRTKMANSKQKAAQDEEMEAELEADSDEEGQASAKAPDRATAAPSPAPEDSQGPTNLGRKKFKGTGLAGKQMMAEESLEETEEVPAGPKVEGFAAGLTGALKFSLSKSARTKIAQNSARASAPAPTEAPEANPWLQPDQDDQDTPTKAERKGKEAGKSKEEGKKARAAKAREAKVALDLAHLQASLQPSNGLDSSGALNLSAVSGEQRQLIARAFAADHITEDALQQEKDEEAAQENEVEAEYAEKLLPGWGEWAGAGARPSKRREKLLGEMKAKKEARHQEILSQRSDASLSHVIINQKKEKKMAKYQVSEAPYPFTSQDAYERSLRMPLGKAWNTSASHKALIAPKISTKSGAIIKPLHKKLG